MTATIARVSASATSGTSTWLNSLTEDTVVELAIQSSVDGETWNDEASMETTGGSITSAATGQPYEENTLTVRGINPEATQVRSLVTVSGPSAVSVTGTISAQ